MGQVAKNEVASGDLEKLEALLKEYDIDALITKHKPLCSIMPSGMNGPIAIPSPRLGHRRNACGSQMS